MWMHVCCRFADGDEVDYHAFLAGINWIEHPAPPVVPEDILKVRERNVSNAYKIKAAKKKEDREKKSNFLNESESGKAQ